MLLISFNKSCFWVTTPKVTEAERPFYLRSRMVLHVIQTSALAVSFGAILSCDILDFGLQLSVCIDGLTEGKATE